MRDRRRLIAVSFLICVFGLMLVPSTAQAGPLLDWLFQRNRSQGLAGSAYSAGYGAAPNSSLNPGGYASAANNAYGYGANYGGQSGYGANGYGSSYGNTTGYRGTGAGNGYGLLSKCCLFGGGRAGYASQNPNTAGGLAAGQPNPAAANRTTVGYGGGSCGQGWCQQTVLQYVPQVAYRTAYQPVPVTTYKTTTAINPQNGLPRTCTRPCTSYTYQARRVPYTTYRPVYTQVPVTDDGFAGAAAPASLPQQPLRQQPTYALQPTSPNAAGGCTSCQNNGFQPTAPSFSGSQYGAPRFGASPFTGTVPGYTPGGSLLPPDPRANGAWSNQPLAPPTSSYGAGPQATPWRPVAPSQSRGQYYGEPGGWQRADPADGYRSSDSYAQERSGRQPTPWGPVSGDGMVTPPPSFGGSGDEADRRPSLRIDTDRYYDDYTDTDRSNRLKPVPIPEDIQRRLRSQPSSEFQPNTRIDGRGDTTSNTDPYGDRYYGERYSAARNIVPTETPRRESVRNPTTIETDLDRRLFSTPQRPITSAPRAMVRETQGNRNETPPAQRRFDARGIPDYDRIKTDSLQSDDKTATNETSVPQRASQTSPTTAKRGVMPLYEGETKTTRYAAAPIDWSAEMDNRERVPAESNRGLSWSVR